MVEALGAGSEAMFLPLWPLVLNLVHANPPEDLRGALLGFIGWVSAGHCSKISLLASVVQSLFACVFVVYTAADTHPQCRSAKSPRRDAVFLRQCSVLGVHKCQS